MAKGHIKGVLKAPTGSNRLSTLVGKIIAKVRVGRGITMKDAAAQLGISDDHYSVLEKGRILPGPNLSKRILAWMTQGISFEGAPPISESVWALDVDKRDYRILKTVIPIADAKAYANKARALGMSPQSLTLLLIRNFMATQGLHVVLKEAAEVMNETRITQALREVPELRDILRAELPICVKLGAHLTPWHAIEKPAILQLAETRLDDVPSLTVPLVQEETDEDDL